MEGEIDLSKNKKEKKIGNINGTVDKNFLDLFWRLVETKQTVRVSSSVSILRILLQKQKESGNEDKKCNELSYSLDRLIFGMPSSRKAARQGFCVLLTEVLRSFPAIAIDEVLGLVEKHLPLHKKEEKSATLIGQFLVYSAIVNSGRLKDCQFLSLVLMNFYKLSAGKDYLQGGTYKLMCELFSQIDEERFSNDVLPHLQKDLQYGWECSPDKLWLLLLVHRMFPQALSAKFLRKHWDGEDLLSEETYEHWKKLLKQSTVVHPQLHPMCSEFIDLCIQKKTLKNIWKPVVEDNLFESDQNEKTFLGFHIVKEVLKKVQKKKQIKTVMSPRFCSTLSRAFGNKRHPLYTAAQDLIDFLCDLVKNASEADQQITILTSILQAPSNVPFDQLLKKKEILLMISSLNSEAVKDFYQFLKAIVLHQSHKSGEENVADEGFKRIQVVVQIGTLVSHPAVSTDMNWRLDVIKFLFLHSYFSVYGQNEEFLECEAPTEFFSESLRSAFRGSLLKALDSLNRKTETASNPSMQAAENLQLIFDYADSLLSINAPLTPLFSIAEIEKPWSRAKKQLKKIKKNCKRGNNVNEYAAFKLLFLHLGLQLFQDTKQIPGILEELEICCKNALSADKAQAESETETEKEDQTDESSHPWVQVLVDVLLSLMSQSSHHLRSVVNFVFPLICPFMTLPGLELILDVIKPQKDDDSALIDEDMDDEEEMDFESGSSSDSNDDDDDTKETADADQEQFKLRLQKVLGQAVDNDEEDSEVVLSDSEMFKLDDALSEAFRSRKKVGHLQPTLEEKTLLNFKIRCLDMIMSYFKIVPPLSITLKCIKPLLSAYEYSKENKHRSHLGNKCLNTLKVIAKVRKFKEPDDCSQQDLIEMLEYLIHKTHKESNPAVSNVLHSLCTFLILCERKFEGKQSNEKESGTMNISPGLEKYFNALASFVEKRNSHITVHMFVTLMNACPEKAWLFVHHLTQYSFDEAILLFKRTQCLGLMIAAIKFAKGQQSVTKELWSKFAKRVIPKVIEAIQSMMSNDALKPLYSTELFALINTTETILKEKLCTSVIKKQTELLTTLTAMTDAQIKSLGKKGKSQRRKLIVSLGGYVVTSKKSQKRKRDQDDETDTVPANKRNGNLSSSENSS